MQDNIFTVKDLSFSYGKQKVLENVSFTLRKGAITTFIGSNGCGKSTLFHLMTKDLKPDTGTILLRDKNIAEIKRKEFAQQAAIVHQYNTAPLDISVEKLVSYGRTPYHTMGLSPDAKTDWEKVKWAMEITDIYKHREKAVSQLSGGQKQRVWIAMALSQDTKILFLDEPTTYLDIRYQLQILRLIRRLNREYELTITMILHDINQSLHYSDEIIAMKNGNILAQGNPEEIITSKLIQTVFDAELTMITENGKPFILPV